MDFHFSTATYLKKLVLLTKYHISGHFGSFKSTTWVLKSLLTLFLAICWVYEYTCRIKKTIMSNNQEKKKILITVGEMGDEWDIFDENIYFSTKNTWNN